MGPLRQLDEIGLDTAVASGVAISEVIEPRAEATALLVALVKAKQLGIKSRAGVYVYPGKRTNPALEALTGGGRGTTENESANKQVRAEDLFAGMVAEAGRLMSEKKAAAWQIDAASIFGLGFPSWRGGLLWWAEHAD